MASRIFITLEPDERGALGEIAKREYRDFRAQAKLFIRQGIEREGYLLNSEKKEKQDGPAGTR